MHTPSTSDHSPKKHLHLVQQELDELNRYLSGLCSHPLDRRAKAWIDHFCRLLFRAQQLVDDRLAALNSEPSPLTGPLAGEPEVLVSPRAKGTLPAAAGDTGGQAQLAEMMQQIRTAFGNRPVP